jgi:hypothetical protein
LGDRDLRAQKISTKSITIREYEKLIADTDIGSSQYLMLHKARDARMTATKILHDYKL